MRAVRHEDELGFRLAPLTEELLRSEAGRVTEAAGELLTAAGLTRNGNQWMLPSGEPFKITLTIPPEGVMNRLGVMVAQLWSQGGVETQAEVVTDGWDRQAAGNYECNVAWAVETWGGHPALSFFLDSYHSEYIAEPGALQPPRNCMRWQNTDLDRIVARIRRAINS